MCRERANPMPELDNRELYFGLERDPSHLSNKPVLGHEVPKGKTSLQQFEWTGP